MSEKMSELALQIYNARKRANMTQAELAKRMGVRRQTVSLWEVGGKAPSKSNLIKMCDIFGSDFMKETIISSQGMDKKITDLYQMGKLEKKAIASCVRFAASYDFMNFKGDQIPEDFDKEGFLKKYGSFYW